ncbi:aminotransferase class V-fold PLP-dependent enzyme [Auraticoccus sp. F435]|uniref:Aminotransferase class V-fold PLP-dependent enzyme n=1 Tax=Auraticoccus cholistanensis TaxID=2656650 RepID=A0A6A9UU31_9ACTN|nr:cysteine desulfurase family protein [Auraticoccus cholistanensis]MVA75094.1 aminotransferase class V-fold PLP-dependent enzyme [Auraticoccus cholistanensis]
MTYLDEAATSPVRRQVLEAMWPWLVRDFANPASSHEAGASARRGLDDARARIARALGGRPGEVVLTSGGTEADNLAVKGIALAEPRGRHLLVSAVEHPAVLESAAFLARTGFEVELLPVDGDGLVRPEVLAAALRDDTTLVSVQLANNEVGTVQPVAELAAVAAGRGVPFHTDAVQAAPWQRLDVAALGVRALSLSGHKLGTPKGVGALWLHRRQPVEPLVHGGGQQRGLRSGTEDVAGAVGLATALELVGPVAAAEVAARRDRFVARVLAGVPGARLTGHPTRRLPGHASFVLPGTSGESVLVDLDARGIACSSGSACAAGRSDPSHVLTAMGFEAEVAQTAVRFSFGAATSEAELDHAADTLVQVVTGV